MLIAVGEPNSTVGGATPWQVDLGYIGKAAEQPDEAKPESSIALWLLHPAPKIRLPSITDYNLKDLTNLFFCELFLVVVIIATRGK